MHRFADRSWWLRNTTVATLISLAPLAASAQRVAQSVETEIKSQTAEKSRFLRVVRDDGDEPRAMETAIVSYVPNDSTRRGLVVDLIGAVHVADRNYYRNLNRLFASYDAVLYELVAPEGTTVPKGGGGSTSTVSILQTSMTRMLDLTFQLNAIDYTRKNMVRADLTPEEFSQSMRDRGESFMQIFFRMMGHAIAQDAKDPGGTSDIRLLSAFFAKDRAFELKRVLAEQFEDLEATAKLFAGPQGSTLVTVRNQRVVDVLRREIAGGRKKLAVFYGAAHMPDLAERVADQLRLEPGPRRWIVAWDLSRKDQ